MKDEDILAMISSGGKGYYLLMVGGMVVEYNDGNDPKPIGNIRDIIISYKRRKDVKD